MRGRTIMSPSSRRLTQTKPLTICYITAQFTSYQIDACFLWRRLRFATASRLTSLPGTLGLSQTSTFEHCAWWRPFLKSILNLKWGLTQPRRGLCLHQLRGVRHQAPPFLFKLYRVKKGPAHQTKNHQS